MSIWLGDPAYYIEHPLPSFGTGSIETNGTTVVDLRTEVCLDILSEMGENINAAERRNIKELVQEIMYDLEREKDISKQADLIMRCARYIRCERMQDNCKY